MQRIGSQFLALMDTFGTTRMPKTGDISAARRSEMSNNHPDTPTKGHKEPMQRTPGGGFIDGDDYWPPLSTYDNMVDRGETKGGPMRLR